MANRLILIILLEVTVFNLAAKAFSFRHSILSRYPLQLLAARWLAVGFPLLSGLGGKVALRMGVCDRVGKVVLMLILAGMCENDVLSFSVASNFVT